MTPLYNKVLIKVDAPEEQTVGGIIIPDSDKIEPNTGTIVAVGAKADPSLIPGTKVMFERFAGLDVEIDGVFHLIMPDNLILGIL